MRRLFAVVIVLVAAVAVLGFYRGWFSVDWEKKPDGTGQVTGTVDQNKIQDDRNRAVEKVQDLGRSKASATEKTKGGD